MLRTKNGRPERHAHPARILCILPPPFLGLSLAPRIARQRLNNPSASSRRSATRAHTPNESNVEATGTLSLPSVNSSTAKQRLNYPVRTLQPSSISNACPQIIQRGSRTLILRTQLHLLNHQAACLQRFGLLLLLRLMKENTQFVQCGSQYSVLLT